MKTMIITWPFHTLALNVQFYLALLTGWFVIPYALDKFGVDLFSMPKKRRRWVFGYCYILYFLGGMQLCIIFPIAWVLGAGVDKAYIEIILRLGGKHPVFFHDSPEWIDGETQKIIAMLETHYKFAVRKGFDQWQITKLNGQFMAKRQTWPCGAIILRDIECFVSALDAYINQHKDEDYPHD